MKEVTDKKDNQMEEPKYDKSIYTLKEAIKAEVKNILSEKKGDDDDAKDEKKAAKGVKGKDKKLKALDKEVEKLDTVVDRSIPLLQNPYR